MEKTTSLPKFLVQRYHGWKATTFADNKVWYKRLADEGQRPHSMVISCCDSRIHVTSIFGADSGEFFIHRNIANLVPPYEPTGDRHGTSAALEYAITSLNVAHVIVMGHSNCGGVAGCHAMCSGEAPELEKDSSFVGRWMDILRPGFDRLDTSNAHDQQIETLEKEGVKISLENLMTFPFVVKAIEDDKVMLHGLWVDISAGELHEYVPEEDSFRPI